MSHLKTSSKTNSKNTLRKIEDNETIYENGIEQKNRHVVSKEIPKGPKGRTSLLVNKKPCPPPKPLSNQKSFPLVTANPKKVPTEACHFSVRKSESDIYADPMPVKIDRVAEIENGVYDMPLNVCIDKLDKAEMNSHRKVFRNTGYEEISLPMSGKSTEPLYEEPLFIPPKSPSRVPIKNKEAIVNNQANPEAFSDDEEDASKEDYCEIHKFKNLERATWLEKVESMRSTKQSNCHIKPRVKELLEQWDSNDDLDDELGDIQLSLNDNEMLNVRRNMLKALVKDEKMYAEKLKKISEAKNSSPCIVGAQKDIAQVFKVITDLLYLHKTFSKDLEKVVTLNRDAGDIIEKFVHEEMIQVKEYTQSYQAAMAVATKSKPSNFDSGSMKRKDRDVQAESNNNADPSENSKEAFLSSLTIPITHFQNCIHSIKKLIRCTTSNHADYNHLQNALAMTNDFFNEFSATGTMAVEDRYLVKKGLVVEQVETRRKLRYLFLFSDVLVCAKQKLKDKFIVIWFIPLCYLNVGDKLSASEDKEMGKFYKDKYNDVKTSLIKYQAEYAKELKRDWNFVRNRKLENIKKKLMELEAEMILNSPYLKLQLISPQLGKNYTILMASDYERVAWKSALYGSITKSRTDAKVTLSQVNLLINNIKASKFGVRDDIFESSRIDGMLKVTIHKLCSLKTPEKVFCTIEIDSFGHFFMKAKTSTVTSIEPQWNEDFDIDLEGAQTLRIICNQIGVGNDLHLGSAALELNEAWLKEKFSEENVQISSNMSLKISIEYKTLEERCASGKFQDSGSYFGIPLEEITKRESSSIPSLVVSCIKEIEKRGMQDLGLYRVSGLSAAINKLQATFNKNSTLACSSLSEVDVNVLTGVVKLFFRELPDPLFPSSKYDDFVNCLLEVSTQDENLAFQLMSLPETNIETILYLLKHLVKVSEQEQYNKMTLGNLATIFGPSLLRNMAPVKNGDHGRLLPFEATTQCKIVLRLLTMVARGYNFKESKS